MSPERPSAARLAQLADLAEAFLRENPDWSNDPSLFAFGQYLAEHDGMIAQKAALHAAIEEALNLRPNQEILERARTLVIGSSCTGQPAFYRCSLVLE